MSPRKQPTVETSACGVTRHTPKEAAKSHGVSDTEIYRALWADELPGIKRGRAWTIRCADVEAWIESTGTANAAELERAR